MQSVSVHALDAVDLQLHTTYSDGTWTPPALFAHLAATGFRVAAITDHDYLASNLEMVELGQRHGIAVIPAVEATAAWQGHLAHLLCFARSFEGTALAEVVQRTARLQLENTTAVYDELRRRGCEFPRQAETLAKQTGVPVRPIDNAHLLVAHGYAATLAEALEMIEAAGFRTISADLATAVAAAHLDGGVALIAHPGRGESGFTDYTPVLLDAVRETIPLDGIEVRYPTHTPAQVAEYDAYARRHGLLRSAGSDSHGPGQRLPVPYKASDVRELLERCGIYVTQ